MIFSMDEHRRGYSLKAPGSAGSPLRLPGRGPLPSIEDHLVEAEVTRDEVVGGRRMVAFPAHAPHATQQTDLDYVLRAHVAPGFHAATDLLTRYDQESDFASDTCIFKDGVDPGTGVRYLEEIAFEVVSEQNERVVTEKALRMHRRGVRRIFAVWVKDQRLDEWSAESRGWRPLGPDARIEDPCLVKPLSVAALLDAATADNAVAEALIVKGNPELQKREAAARSEGEAAGLALAIVNVLEARGITVSESQRQSILLCRDLDRLHRWSRRAALAVATEEVTSEP